MANQQTKQHPIYAIGRNTEYQFGLNDNQNVKELIQWTHKNNHISINKINSGNGYIIITDNNGNLWSMGWNNKGQCGVPNKSDRIRVPEQITYFKKNNITIQQVFTSNASLSTFFITTDNKIYGNGRNDRHQLGAGHTKNEYEPKIIECLTNTIKVCSSLYYAVCIDDKGSAYSTTFSQYGGNGHKENDDNDRTWKKIKAFHNTKIVNIETGRYHSVFLDSEGMLWSVGYNGDGQCGNVNNSNSKGVPLRIKDFVNNKIKIREIKCGSSHNLSIDYDGNVWCWGCNKYGECGVGTTENVLRPKRIERMNKNKVMTINCGANHSHLMSENKEHFLFGRNDYNECSLSNGYDSKITAPHSINDIVKEKSNGMQIKSVYLGEMNTMIMVCDFDKFEDKKDEFDEFSDDDKKDNVNESMEKEVIINRLKQNKLNELNFIKLKIEKLEKKNESDQIDGEYLADLNRNDLRMHPFNISHFGDRRDLEQHFKSPKNKKYKKYKNNKNNNLEEEGTITEFH